MPPAADLRDYLAVERTFLAWLRTGLALMGFGFVVARFGLLIRELSVGRTGAISNYGISTRFGTALVIAGVAVTLISLYRYRRLLDRLDRGEMLRGPSRLVVTI